jgi:uncharacterized Fe-S center protein
MEKVYFCKDITPENIVRLYEKLGKELNGNVAVKVHSGEKGNQNFLRPEMFKAIVERVNGTIVECNTAYGEAFGDGERDLTYKHLKVIEEHGWNKYFNVDLMDADGPDIKIDIPNGKVLKEDILGKNIQNYDSMLVLSHFKGHPMGGYGGALKQLSIGCSSAAGKALIHSAGKTTDRFKAWEGTEQKLFLESMADAASAVVKYFKGNMAFINIMANLSVDCDCCSVAEDPCMKDIGILASLDPIAIDQACIDLVVKSNDPGKDHFLERVNSRNGIHTIEAAAELGFGSRKYELINI